MPVACMKAYITVDPTNLNPRFFKSLLIASEIGEVAGTFKFLGKLITGVIYKSPNVLRKTSKFFLDFRKLVHW
jgi:hypothetical protein